MAYLDIPVQKLPPGKVLVTLGTYEIAGCFVTTFFMLHVTF